MRSDSDTDIRQNDDGSEDCSYSTAQSASRDIDVFPSHLLAGTIHNDNNAPEPNVLADSPKVQALTARIPGQDEPLFFKDELMLPDDNCGFTELRVLRAEVVAALERAAILPEGREALSKEIYNAFATRALTPYPGWESLNEVYQSASRAYDEIYLNIKRGILGRFHLRSTSPCITEENIHEFATPSEIGMISNRKLACVEPKNDLMKFCKKYDVVMHYIQAFHRNEKQKGLPLGVDSACVYAKEKNLSVYFWVKKGDQLEIYKEYIASAPNAHKAHFLMSDSMTDYFPLVLVNNNSLQAHQKNEWAKKLLDNKDLVKTEISRFLIEALNSANNEQFIQQEIFLWLLDILVLPSDMYFLKQASIMHRSLREKKEELDQKTLESYKTYLMLEAIDGDPDAKKGTFHGIEYFYKSTGDDLSKSKSPTMPRQRYDGLVNKINFLFDVDSLLGPISKENFEELILSGKYGHRFTRKDACFYPLREPYSGEVILLKKDKDHVFSPESILFCSGGTKFKPNDRYNLNHPKKGISLECQPGTRKHVAETLKTEWLKLESASALALSPASRSFTILQRKLRCLGEGIFEELAFIWREGKHVLSFGQEKVGRLFGENSEVIHLLNVLIFLESILNAPDRKFKEALIQLKNDEQASSWFKNHASDIDEKINFKKGMLKFLEDIPSLKYTDYDLVKLKLKDIRNYCLGKGAKLCAEQEVCLKYMNLYVENPDQWLCEAGKKWYWEIEKHHLSAEPPEWFEMQEFSMEEILQIARGILGDPRRVTQFDEPMLVKVRNFVQGQSRSLDREILEFCAKGRGFELREFSIIDVSRQTNHSDLPKIGRLRVAPSSKNLPANSRVWNVVFNNGVYKKLVLEENHFTVKYNLRVEPPMGVLLKNEIYIEREGDYTLKYTVIDGANRQVTSTLSIEDLPFLANKIQSPLDVKAIQGQLPGILKITTARGHTRKRFIDDFFSEVAQELKDLLLQNLALPKGAKENPGFDYNAHVKEQLNTLIEHFSQLLIKENQEIKEISEKYGALLAQLGALTAENSFKETRADKLAKMPLSAYSYLKSVLLQDLARKLLGYTQLPTEEDLEGLGHALCDFEFTIDEVQNEKGSLFYILLDMNVPDYFLKEFLKRSPDPFLKTSITGESPMEYLSRKAIKNEGKNDPIEKFVFCACHVIESLSLLLVAERHFVKGLSALQEADEKTSDFLIDNVKEYIQQNKEDLEKKLASGWVDKFFKIRSFDKTANRNESIVRLLSIFAKYLESKDYKNALLALKEAYQKIEGGAFGKLGSRLMTMLDEYITVMTEIMKKESMAVAVKAYDALRLARSVEEKNAKPEAVDNEMKEHASEIAKLVSDSKVQRETIYSLGETVRARDKKVEVQAEEIHNLKAVVAASSGREREQVEKVSKLENEFSEFRAMFMSQMGNQINNAQGGKQHQSPRSPRFFGLPPAGHRFCLMVSGVVVEKGAIYIEKQGDWLKYTMIDPENRFLTGTLSTQDLPALAGKIAEHLNLEELKPLLPQMLEIILAREATFKNSLS